MRVECVIAVTFLLVGCGNDTSKMRQGTQTDACACDCGPEPDGFTDPEGYGWDAYPRQPDGGGIEIASPLAENPNAPLCNGTSVNLNGPCLGMCGPRCSGIL